MSHAPCTSMNFTLMQLLLLAIGGRHVMAVSEFQKDAEMEKRELAFELKRANIKFSHTSDSITFPSKGSIRFVGIALYKAGAYLGISDCEVSHD